MSDELSLVSESTMPLEKREDCDEEICHRGGHSGQHTGVTVPEHQPLPESAGPPGGRRHRAGGLAQQ